MVSKRLLLVLLSILLISISFTVDAQCSMCRMAAADSDYANGLNTGILYLLSAPFVFIGLVSLIWIKNKDKFSGHEF